MVIRMKKIVVILILEFILLLPIGMTNMETEFKSIPFQQQNAESVLKNTDTDKKRRTELISLAPDSGNIVDRKQAVVQETTASPPKEVKERKEGQNISRHDERKRAEIFEATAYCSCVKCCGKSDGITASGVKVHPGTLAVDPKVIPFGTQVYIEGMGWFIAEDTGNFSGKRIDIYMETHEKALQFGRKKVKVIY
jgi:3D (Asp-Asp-Asp) domain-containing protein